jgi:ubiquitin carboxyl-terminal hydrolase 7
VERIINDLFEGHTYSFVECSNVDYKSTRRESFMDLQLDVKGCNDIYDSFKQYCEVEELSGANQYNAEGHGLQVGFLIDLWIYATFMFFYLCQICHI